MIPKKFTGNFLKGKKATVNCDLRNKGGAAVSAGTVVTIVSVVKGKGLTIKTEKCEHCGQSAYITGVEREKLSLIKTE